jgi:hypothetical protein
MDDITEKLHTTTDAQVWASEFMKVVEAGATVDEGLMIGWFANAIETAKRLAAADVLEEMGKAMIR